MDMVTTRTTPWTRARRVAVKHREHSHAYIEGFYVSADIDEYDRRWYVSGRLAGHDASLSGHMADGTTLAQLEQTARDAVADGIAAGMTPR